MIFGEELYRPQGKIVFKEQLSSRKNCLRGRILQATEKNCPGKNGLEAELYRPTGKKCPGKNCLRGRIIVIGEELLQEEFLGEEFSVLVWDLKTPFEHKNACKFASQFHMLPFKFTMK